MYILILFIALVCSNEKNNQILNTIPSSNSITRVVYNFSHMRDTNNPSRMYKERMQLVCNAEIALYNSFTKKQQDSIRDVQIREAERVGNNMVVNRGLIVPYSNDQMTTSIKDKIRSVFLYFNNNPYKISEPLENIKWQIGKEVKNIAGYPCQKATCNFKGRNYTAWFTTDIPLPFGPWKLHGLPGLILEATDEKKQVQFSCESISRNMNASAIKFPQDAIKTTKKDFDRMVEAFENDPAAFAKNNPNFKVEIEGLNSSTTSSKKSSINNPIELSDK